MATETREKPETIPFYPDHIRTEAWVSFGVLVVLLAVGVLGLLFPVGLGPPADPLDTPAHVKPEWYFLALYQVLKFVPKTVGVLIPIVGVIALMLWPFLDRRAADPARARRRRFIAVGVFLIIVLALTIWGEVS